MRRCGQSENERTCGAPSTVYEEEVLVGGCSSFMSLCDSEVLSRTFPQHVIKSASTPLTFAASYCQCFNVVL